MRGGLFLNQQGIISRIISVYSPGMMTFSGGYYNKTSVNLAGNLFTVMARINRDAFTGGGVEIIFDQVIVGNASGRVRLLAISNDFSDARAGKLQAYCVTSSSAVVTLLVSTDVLWDGTDKTIFFAVDTTAGTALLYVNGVDADDTGSAFRQVSTGTLNSGTGNCYVGSDTNGATNWGGEIGYVGYSNTYLTNPTDFYHPTNGLQEIDETTWTEWGAQPLFWNQYGYMVDNKGSAGNMTANGQIIEPIDVGYDPGMMTYDGSTGYYNKSLTVSASNLCTTVIRFNRASFTGGAVVEYLIQFTNSGFLSRIRCEVFPSDYSDVNLRNRCRVIVFNTSSTIIALQVSNVDVCTGSDVVLFYSFDGDNGTSVFYVNGVDADDATYPTKVAPTTGTLPSGASSEIAVGAAVGGTLHFEGDIGYCGVISTYLTNPTDFYHPTNGLQELDEATWTEWGSQPLFWNQYGTMTDNKGSAGNMTANGTITGPA